MGLKVLITNHDLSQPGGTQLYTVDLARALKVRGHAPRVFSPRPGMLSDRLRELMIPVVSRLEDLGEAPDVIHGHHLLETASAVLRFPGVPAVFVCHGWFPWQETPPLLPRVLRYLAVDSLRRERLVNEHGVPPEMVEIVPNFVDLDRFPVPRPRPERPSRALALSNGTRVGPWLEEVRAACARRGIELAVMGVQEGNAVANTAAALDQADVVFARGRAAIEASASGAFVILCDREGLGPALVAERGAELRRANFGAELLVLGHGATADRLEEYSPAAAAAASRWIRAEVGAGTVVERLVEIYRQVIAEAAARPASAAAEAMALARLFERVNALLSGYEALAIREYEHRVALANHERTRWNRAGAWLTSRVPGFWRFSR